LLDEKSDTLLTELSVDHAALGDEFLDLAGRQRRIVQYFDAVLFEVNSQFKRCFSLTVTVSAALRAVNRKVLADNSTRSMIFGFRRRLEAAILKVIAGLCPSAGL